MTIVDDELQTQVVGYLSPGTPEHAFYMLDVARGMMAREEWRKQFDAEWHSLAEEMANG